MPDPVVVQTPNQPVEDPRREQLRQMAIAADTEGEPTESPAGSTQDPASRAAGSEGDEIGKVGQTDNAGTSTERTRDETGKFTKADGTQSETEKTASTSAEQKTGEQSTESDYAKKVKENARKEKTWQQIEEEKRKVREKEAELTAREREIEAKRNAPPKAEPDTFTSVQYENAAKGFETRAEQADLEGNHAEASRLGLLAIKARRAAAGLRENEQKAEFAKGADEFRKTWHDGMQAVIKEDPAAGDPNSPIAKTIKSLFEEEQIFSHIPDGFRKAHFLAKLKLDAVEVPALRETIKKLTAENERYKQLTSLDGGGPITATTAKTFDNMSQAERREYLRSNSAIADGVAA